MSEQRTDSPNQVPTIRLIDGYRIPKTHPNAIVEWTPGKPPGGVPVKKPTGRQNYPTL